MSRNARSNENGRFDEIFLERVNVHGFDDFNEFSPFPLLHAFLDISHIFLTQKCFFLGKKNRQRTRMKETRDRAATDPGQRLFLLYT